MTTNSFHTPAPTRCNYRKLERQWPEPTSHVAALCEELREASEDIPILCRELANALSDLGAYPTSGSAVCIGRMCILDLSMGALRLTNHAEQLSDEVLPPWHAQRVLDAGRLATIAWEAADAGTEAMDSLLGLTD
jgi:hypothetical protein